MKLIYQLNYLSSIIIIHSANISTEEENRANYSFLFILSDNGNPTNTFKGYTAKVMRQAIFWIIDLTVPCSPMQLKVHLIYHSQSGRTNGVAETLEPAVNLAGNHSIGIEESIQAVFDSLPPL